MVLMFLIKKIKIKEVTEDHNTHADSPSVLDVGQGKNHLD